MGRTLRGAAAMAVAGLAACASPGAELALKAPEMLVGLPETELLACAGVPQKRESAGEGERLIYSRTQTIVEREVEYDDFPRFGRGPRILRPAVTTWSRSYSCEATATVSGGRVQAVAYNENRDITLCYEILSACLPPPKR